MKFLSTIVTLGLAVLSLARPYEQSTPEEPTSVTLKFTAAAAKYFEVVVPLDGTKTTVQNPLNLSINIITSDVENSKIDCEFFYKDKKVNVNEVGNTEMNVGPPKPIDEALCNYITGYDY